MNLKNVILIAFFAVWTLIAYGNESEKLLATRFVATTETGVHKYELEQTNKSLKNKKVYLYYCDKTGCVFISREESVAVINGAEPIIILLSGNVIKFHEPSFVSATVGEAVFTAEKLYKDNPLVVYPNDFGEFRIHMSDFIPQPQTFEKSYVYKIISAKMNGDGYEIKCLGGGGDSVDSVEVFVNGDLTVDTIKLNGNKVPIRLERQLSIERKQDHIFMDNKTGIKVSINTIDPILDLKDLYSYSSLVYIWTGRYKLEFNGEIAKGRYRTVCMPEYNIYWTGPHEMSYWFINKNNRLAIIDIQKNLDICITEIYPYEKNIEPNVAVKNSFESFLRLSKENNHLTEINKENYFKKMNKAIIINPQDMLGVDFSEIGIDHSSLRITKVRPDDYYDVEVQLSGDNSIALNRGDEVCTILINTENGEADCVLRGKRAVN